MSSPGRNDPCPCGSGRKYKYCCSGSDEGRFNQVSASRTRESAISKLLAFAFQPAFDSDHAVAETVFWGDAIRQTSLADLQPLMDSEDATVKYNSWFLFDWDVDGEDTVAELFLAEEGARLSAAERQFLERLSAVPLRLYEVEAVQPGHGMRLRDLWTRTRTFVVERTASAQIVRWDLLAGRVAPDGMGGEVFEGSLYLYPAEAKEGILAHFRRLYRRYHRKFPTHDTNTFFRRHGMVFHHLWLSLVAFPEPPTVTTSDGDPLVFCRAVFDTRHAADARDRLSRQPDVRAVDEERFVWTEPDDDGERVIGTWSVDGERIVLETTSQERAERGRAWIERLLGDMVRYRATGLETLAEAMQDLRGRPEAPDAEEPCEAEAEAVRELYDRHYHEWLDRPVPALGNRTPRCAAGTTVWRRRLTDLLKQMENTAARGALAGRPPYDFEWLWNELGLDRPGS